MTDKEKLIKLNKLADAMYYAAFNLTTDASLLRKAMKEYHQFIIHEYCKEELVAPKVLEDMLNAKTAAESLGISPEEHDKIVDKCLYGKEPELVDIDDLPVVIDAPSEDYVKGFADGRLYEQRQKSETSVWHDANKFPDNPEDIVIEHSEYGTAIIPACKMSRVKGAKWARLDDILKL